MSAVVAMVVSGAGVAGGLAASGRLALFRHVAIRMDRCPSPTVHVLRNARGRHRRDQTAESPPQWQRQDEASGQDWFPEARRQWHALSRAKTGLASGSSDFTRANRDLS
jgi:hypothetical protein